MTSARVQETDLGNVDTAIALYRKVLEIDPLSLAAAESLERLFRASERYAGAVDHPAAQVRDPRGAVGQEGRALPGRARSRRTCSNRPEAAIAVYTKVLEIDADDLRAIDALIRRYLDLSRWQDLLAVYAQKADLVADVEEKKGIYYQVGAVYERELGDVPRAIDTYTKILELDPDDLQALSRLDVLYEQRRELGGAPLGAHARERDDGRSERGDQLPVPDRGALREAPRRRAPRGRALSQHPPAADGPRADPPGARGPEGRRRRSARRRRRARARVRGDRATGRS